MNLEEMSLREMHEEIKKPISNFDIRKMIIKSCPPFEWATSNRSHPIEQFGYFYFGIGDGFHFDESKIQEADELLLWKLYGLIQTYWLMHYREWNKK